MPKTVTNVRERSRVEETEVRDIHRYGQKLRYAHSRTSRYTYTGKDTDTNTN